MGTPKLEAWKTSWSLPSSSGAHVAQEGLARAGEPGEPFARIATALGVARGGRHHVVEPRLGDRVRHVRQRFGGARQVEGALGGGEQAAHHVHVDAGHQMRHELGMADEPGLGARDLGQPEEAQAPPRRGQAAAGDGGTERARDLEDGGAARGVVVGPRRLVAQVRGQHDLAGGGIAARDHGARHVVGGLHHPRLDPRPQHDRLARRAGARAAPRTGASRA